MNVVEHFRASDVEFTNRELGWLQFNRRVLHEAEDARNPLLERVKFLSISYSNLDEFFMKRVGGLKRHVVYGVSQKSSDGKTPQEQLLEIRKHVVTMITNQARIFRQILRPELEKYKIHILKWSQLTAKEKEQVKKFYQKNVFPVLTPLSVDPGHPFPFISNLSTSLGVTLSNTKDEENLFARIKIPKVLPQWIRVENERHEIRLLSLIEVIKANIDDLFPSMNVKNIMVFRLTRNADSDQDPDDTEDLLEMIEEELRQRRFAEVVRLEHGPKPDPWMLDFLIRELEINPEDVYELPDDLDFLDLNYLIDLERNDLKFEPYQPVIPPAFIEEGVQIFNQIKNQDQLVHHPYESFAATVEQFVKVASEDPKVLAIKMTLYRTGENSQFIRSLIRAAEQGKQVVCLIELKARFDEERNIYWAQALEDAGVHVVYGIVGLKTHAKTVLIVRNEEDSVRCYCHIGTGNYNTATSRFYTDLGLFTAKEEITHEIVEFFHYLTGRSMKSNYQKILIAPVNMSPQFKEMVQREAIHAKAGLPAQIIAKFNNMEENDLAISLYQASQSGVEIDLIVRGFCCLRPQVKGLSEKLRVHSIIGRFLEHSRIFYFRNAAKDPIDGEFYIGSADWMYRNLHARVEAVVPILDRQLKEKCWELLRLSLEDKRQTWDMQSDGSYIQRQGSDVGVQQNLMNLTKKRATQAEQIEESPKESQKIRSTGKKANKDS